MKIVTMEELISLPVGTIYSYYQPAICTGLFRKGENVGEADFFEASVMAQCVNGEHPTVDNIQSRWGMFDHNAQFAVYEQADILAMMEMLATMKTIKLTELLTHEQIAEVTRILNKNTGNLGSNKELRDYLCQFREELEGKGVVPEYLAYVLIAKHEKVI